MSTTSVTTTPQVLYGYCSVCGRYGYIFHQYALPRSGRVLVRYCYDCFA